MSQRYNLRDLTPESMRCIVGNCSAIYEITSVKAEDCASAMVGCPTVYGDIDNTKIYLIVGKKLNPKEFGLVEKIAESETLIAVPRSLLDKLKEPTK